MEKTPFAGLTVLEPDEALSTDGGSFTGENPFLIDRMLEVGAVTHRHDAHLRLPNPVGTPSAGVLDTGGAIPSEITLYIGYTLVDSRNGETTLSPVQAVSTQPPYDPPATAPSGVIDYTGGSLLANTYYYLVTLLDGTGGETPASPFVSVEREPGYASGRVQLSNLNADFALNGAVSWRLYRATGGSTFDFLAEGTGSTFTDDGSLNGDCTINPPPETTNNTNETSQVLITVPTGEPYLASATSFRLYASLDGAFESPCFINTYPIASAGVAIALTTLDFERGSPPDVTTALPGASKIDPDTELLDWHWKRPVANQGLLGSGAQGDVRLANDSGKLYAMLKAPSGLVPGDWTLIGGSGGTMRHVQASGSGQALDVETIVFRASGGVQAAVTKQGGSAIVTLYALGTGGGAGASGAPGAPGASGAPGAQGPIGPAGPEVLRVQEQDGTPTIQPTRHVEFGPGSGSVGQKVVDLGGGSARVEIGGAPTGPQGIQGPPGSGFLNVEDADGPRLFGKSYLQFQPSGGVSLGVVDTGGGSARVTIAQDGRRWASGTTVSLASGASGLAAIDIGQSYRLYKIRSSKSARVRMYVASGYRDADQARAIGVDPKLDHGLVTDFVLPSADLDWTFSPMVDGAVMEVSPTAAVPMIVTNMDATGTVTFALLYKQEE